MPFFEYDLSLLSFVALPAAWLLLGAGVWLHVLLGFVAPLVSGHGRESDLFLVGCVLVAGRELAGAADLLSTSVGVLGPLSSVLPVRVALECEAVRGPVDRWN